MGSLKVKSKVMLLSGFHFHKVCSSKAGRWIRFGVRKEESSLTMKIRTKKQELFEKIPFFWFGLSRLQFKYKSVHKSQATRLI